MSPQDTITNQSETGADRFSREEGGTERFRRQTGFCSAPTVAAAARSGLAASIRIRTFHAAHLGRCPPWGLGPELESSSAEPQSDWWSDSGAPTSALRLGWQQDRPSGVPFRQGSSRRRSRRRWSLPWRPDRSEQSGSRALKQSTVGRMRTGQSWPGI